ncbi:hypothetical protein IPU70_30730 [Achromobacter sp. SD115]|uniref:hypothetical protein n=1 Tax=Achromobacter sp. SD115 TaxID=2782011 RepID=UPI001A969432|nr:hypothetical protein [Achromobacter sp. SD115]MBO1017967.1 hypothetical protein [Achromobacter sp. SD115]
MTLNQEKTKKALKSLNWPALREQLESIDLTEDNLEVVLNLVLRCDSMIRRRPGDDGVKRDCLLAEFERYLQERCVAEAAGMVAFMHKTFRSIDKGYIAILSQEENLQFSNLSPEKRVSSILSFLSSVGKQLKLDQDRAVKGAKVLSSNITVEDVNGTSYNPDAAYHGLTLAATDALQLEGYRHSYFDATGELVLPVPMPVSNADKAAAELKLFNAILWRRWKTVDERVRLSQASLKEWETPQLPEWVKGLSEGAKIVTAFEFRPHSEIVLMDVIATERFDVRMVQTFQEILFNTDVPKVIASRSAPEVKLPPHGVVSVEEVHAGTMLSQYLCLPLDKTKAGSLLLSERLRGYAVLKLILTSAVGADGTYFPVFTRGKIHAELIRFGLSEASADIFIKTATFNRSSRDLYDQPMIRLASGSYLLFGFSIVSSNLVKLMLSSLENAKHSFPGRGPAFEQHILDLLREQSFDAKTLKVKRGNPKAEYDYDVTFVWGDYVFFIECKNRGIPFGNPVAVANFANEVRDHTDQVKRLRQGLLDYPDIISADYPEAIDKKPVFCVVFSLPFAMGYHDDVYYIDESLLSRFFKPGGSFGFELGRAGVGEQRCRVEFARLWESDAPTPEDFIRYLENPPQLQLAKARYKPEADFISLSDDVAVACADWHRKHLKDDEVARILAKASEKMKAKPGSKAIHASN